MAGILGALVVALAFTITVAVRTQHDDEGEPNRSSVGPHDATIRMNFDISEGCDTWVEWPAVTVYDENGTILGAVTSDDWSCEQGDWTPNRIPVTLSASLNLPTAKQYVLEQHASPPVFGNYMSSAISYEDAEEAGWVLP